MRVKRPNAEFKFICQCLNDTLSGLCEGLSHFSGASRAAVIFLMEPRSDVFILDPQNLLRGHEPKLKELYLESSEWLHCIQLPVYKSRIGPMRREKNLQLAGLVSFGGRASSMYYQMWFTEHHPDMCSIGPTECWLEHAAWRFSHDLAKQADFYTGISGSFLREYATHAVRDFIVDQMNVRLGWDSQLRIYPTLDAILEISRTREEGTWPRGKLLFVETRALNQLQYLIRFPEKETPLIENAKHVRKLLITVENSTRALVSDGRRIVGIADENRPDFSVMADFRGNYGFLNLNEKAVCSFADGRFRSTTYRAKLVQVEEILLESDLNAEMNSVLFRTIAYLVHHAEEERFGCTLIVDLNSEPVAVAGQKLDVALDLMQPGSLPLARSFLKVDGALHIGRKLQLLAFACLLDGCRIAGEDRSRGARFNSALRFTAANHNLFVVVVSADRPVSIIMEGVEINAQCRYQPVADCSYLPKKLKVWIEQADQWPEKG